MYAPTFVQGAGSSIPVSYPSRLIEMDNMNNSGVLQPHLPAQNFYGYGVEAVSEETPVSHPTTPLDAPSFRSLSGLIILLILAMTTISLFICLARTDFNLVFYLMGYYIWCIESQLVDGVHSNFGDNSSNSWVSKFVCTKKMCKSVQQYCFALVAATLVDVSWLLLAFSTWTCPSPTHETSLEEPDKLSHWDPGWCFVGDNKRLAWLLGIHRFVLYSSVVNLLFKILVIVLSFVWLSGQRSVQAATHNTQQHRFVGRT